MKASGFDRKFDEDESVTADLVLTESMSVWSGIPDYLRGLRGTRAHGRDAHGVLRYSHDRHARWRSVAEDLLERRVAFANS